MEEKVFREFQINTYEANEGYEVAKMKGLLYTHKVTIDLAKVNSYRDTIETDIDGNDIKATNLEMNGSEDLTILTPYKVFDKIMREAFPEAYK